MSDAPTALANPKSGNLGTTLATWLYILEDAGHPADSKPVRDAVATLRDAAPDQADHHGAQLAALVDAQLGDSPDFERVSVWLRSLFGNDALRTAFGDDRDSRLRQARAYQFKSSLPWIACIIDRFPDGEVGAHWVMVERITDRVTCMDPYPWDDLDEEYEQPVVEFMVKWELAGCHALAWQG